MFCVYLTTYSGNKMPMYYIGSKDVKSVLTKGYRGSVASIQYKSIWKTELKQNPHLFTTKIISTCSTRTEASGEGNHRFGVKLSDEQKQHLSRVTTGITRSESTRDKHRGPNNSKACPINIDGVYYGCKKDARTALGLSVWALNKIIKESNK